MIVIILIKHFVGAVNKLKIKENVIDDVIINKGHISIAKITKITECKKLYLYLSLYSFN